MVAIRVRAFFFGSGRFCTFDSLSVAAVCAVACCADGVAAEAAVG